MKEKAEALNMPKGPDAAFIKRKKPHTLPPLEKFRNLEGRGSPVPQARRRSSIEEQLLQDEGQVAPGDGRGPLIRLTRCPDDLGSGSTGTAPVRLPPPKCGSLSPPGEVPLLSPVSPISKYAPLQPIRRTSAPTLLAPPDNAHDENRNGNAV